MTLDLSSGFFLGPNTDARGDIIPFNWDKAGNWFVNGASSDGVPGAADVARLGLSGSSLGYEVGVSAGEHAAARRLQFGYKAAAAPAAFKQDLVQEVVGNGKARSASLDLGRLGGNRFGDGYLVVSQGGALQLDGKASRHVSIILGDYTNKYDGSATTVSDQGSNTNTVTIGTPGQTGYNYLHGFSAPIFGVIGQDVVDLSQITYSSSDTYTWTAIGNAPTDGTHGVLNSTFGTPGVLTISDNGTVLARLEIALPTDQHGASGSAFHLVSDHGSLAIMDACYLAGTRILTEQGDVAVEDLVVGQKLVTHRGETMPVKWIGWRSHTGLEAAAAQVAPVLVRTGALADGIPARDLYVSPEHALYLDGVLVPARELVNGSSIRVTEGIDPIRYFHVELESHEVIFAEGAPAETFVDCDSRKMFQNAAEFAELYPEDCRPGWAFCAPVVEAGVKLEAIRHRLATRAGQIDAAAPQDGPMRGYLERVEHCLIAGWAQLEEYPDIPVRLEVLDNGVRIAEVVASQYRSDIEAAGIGNGRYAFQLSLDRPLDPFTRHEIVVRRPADGQMLRYSPCVLPAAESLDAEVRASLSEMMGRAVGCAADPTETAALLGMLQAATERARGAHAGLINQQVVAAASRQRGGGTVAAKRALVIDTEWPRPARDAGSQAIWSHMSSLQRLGYKVEFVAANEMTSPDGSAGLAQAGVACHAHPTASSVEEVLRRHAGRFDLVYMHRVDNAFAYAGLARRYQPRARLIYSVADLHSLRLARQAAVEQRPDLARSAEALRERKLVAMRQVDAVLTHSAYEAALLGQMAPAANVHVVPWAVPARPGSAFWDDRQGVAFVAFFGHSPNIYAVHWLVNEVMPLVWAGDSSVTCSIAGAGLPAKMARTITDPRIRLLGHVPDLTEVYNSARMAIAPLRSGAGIKGKVLEAFAAGLPCVMTPVAAEGLPLAGPLRELVASDAVGLAERVLRLHGDASRSALLGQAGLSMLCRHFSEASVDASLARSLRPAIQPVRSAVA